MAKNVKIGTHDGTFHCDEALACFMLKTLPRYKDAVILRSRNMNILDTCDIVVDVGGEYNPSKHRYDHHMRDFNESVSTVIKKPGYDWTMKLSSAGLIYCHFGHEIIKHLIPQANDSDVELIFKYIYNTFIKEIDGIDNGVPMFNEEPVYRIVTDLSSRVKFLNPAWNSKDINVDSQFLKAVELTGQELVQHINYAANVWLPARSIVQEAIDKRFELPFSCLVLSASAIPGYTAYGAAYHGPPAPLAHDGRVVDTPEVAHAKAAHLAAHAAEAAKAAPLGYGDYSDGKYEDYSGNYVAATQNIYHGPPAPLAHDGRVIDTPEVAHAKAAHLAAHAEQISKIAHLAYADPYPQSHW